MSSSRSSSNSREHAAGDSRMDALRDALDGLDSLPPGPASQQIGAARQALIAATGMDGPEPESFGQLVDAAAAAAPGPSRRAVLLRIKNLLAEIEAKSLWPLPCSLMDRQGDPKPDPLLRGIDCGGSLLSRGEVLVLSGTGGRGKSTLALQWAMAMAIADTTGQDWIMTGGIECHAGRALVLSYEDAGWRVADRATGASKLSELSKYLHPTTEARLVDTLHSRLRFMQMRGYPLFGVREGEHRMNRPGPLHIWRHIWEFATDIDTVIIDPALSAYVADQNDAAFVRLFLDALFTEASERNCGVLLIAHSSKEGRRSGTAEGSVSGSAAWHDAARSVLLLDSPEKTSSNELRLSTVKANYSPLFQRRLEKVTDRNGQFVRMLGFEDAGNWYQPKRAEPIVSSKPISDSGIKDLIEV